MGPFFLFVAVLFVKCKCKILHSRGGYENKKVGFKQLIQFDLEPIGTRNSKIFNNSMFTRRQEQADLAEGLIVKVMVTTNPKFTLSSRGVRKVANNIAVTLLNSREPLKSNVSPAVKNAARFLFQADLRHLVPKASKRPSADRAPVMNIPAPKPPLHRSIEMGLVDIFIQRVGADCRGLPWNTGVPL